MEPPQILYKQAVKHFTMPVYLHEGVEVSGRVMLDLAERFLATLLFPGTRATELHTKRAGEGARLNMVAFTSTRWKASARKILNGEYAVVGIDAATADFPDQKISFSIHVNPPGGGELRITGGDIKLSCSIPYLRHVAAWPDKVEALLQLAKHAWNSVGGGAAYGYGNLSMLLARPLFDPRFPRPPGAPMPWEFIKPPEERVHAVPVAYVGNDIEGNLESLYCNGRGIKGAFWANFLSSYYVDMAGGEQQLRMTLGDMRLESLDGGGLLIVATESPLPTDDNLTADRFSRLNEALRPAFISREETAEIKRGMLGYFYRERSH